MKKGVGVELYHATDDAGRAGIMEHGFAPSTLPDSSGAAWLVTRREHTRSGSRSGWTVIVEMPPSVARKYRNRFKDDGWVVDPYNYLIPCEVLNGYRPFRYEPD